MKRITLLLLLLTAYFGYAQPTNNATDPPARNAADVIAIYGSNTGSYADITGINYDPNWGQSGHTQVNTSFDPGTGNLVMAYPNFNYQGTDFSGNAQTGAASMEYLHVDIWTMADPGVTDIQVSPINNGTGNGETLVSIAYTPGTWTSVDIPKASFTGMTWDSVFQLKFAANGPGSVVPVDIYIDNVYFWKAASNPTTDTTLSDLTVDGTTISGFSAGVTSYTYELPGGTTVAPTVAATTTNGSATTNITQAPSVPGDATVVVTAQDGTTMGTYTVSFVTLSPAMAAPTPPARAAADVISVYSDAYTDAMSLISYNNFDAGWCGGAAVTGVIVEGNNTLKKNSGIVCQGIDFAGDRQDLSGFTHLHFDFYTSDTDLTGDVFNVKVIDFAGGGGEASNFQVNITGGTTPAIVSGSWISVDVDLTEMPLPSHVSGSLTRNDIAQIGITTANLTNVWYDNIYFHKGTTLSNDDFNKTSFKAFPNPTQDSWTVKGQDSQIETINVFDILGKQVLRLSPNNNEARIDGSSLKSGIYFAQIKTLSGINSVKLIKQ